MTFQKNRFGGIFESYKENFGEFTITRFLSLVLSKHPTFMGFGLKIGPSSVIFDI